MRFFELFPLYTRPDSEVRNDIVRLLKADGDVDELHLLSLIKYSKKKHQSVNFSADYGKTALHLAAEKGLTSVVMGLVRADANIDAQDKRRGTPPVIFFAIENGHKKTVKCLKDLGASIEKQWNGRTVLHWALDYGKWDVAEYLLDVGAKLNWVDDCYRTPIATASFNHGLSKDWILEKVKYQIGLGWSDGSEFFVCAAQAGLADLLVYLKESCGVYVNTRRKDGKTALLVVAWQPNKSDEAIMSLLCRMSADVDLQDEKGNAALHYAVENGSLAMTKILINSGAKQNILNKKGQTPLDLAGLDSSDKDIYEMLRHASTEDR